MPKLELGERAARALAGGAGLRLGIAHSKYNETLTSLAKETLDSLAGDVEVAPLH